MDGATRLRRGPNQANFERILPIHPLVHGWLNDIEKQAGCVLLAGVGG